MDKASQGLGFFEVVRCPGYLEELRLIEGRLTTILRRTKTSGPNRQVKELPVCVSERAYFVKPGWLKAGFDLLLFHVRYKRTTSCLR